MIVCEHDIALPQRPPPVDCNRPASQQVGRNPRYRRSVHASSLRGSSINTRCTARGMDAQSSAHLKVETQRQEPGIVTKDTRLESEYVRQDATDE